MIVRAITEAYKSVMTVNAMKEIAADGDFFNFINSFPDIENAKDARIQYTFHVLAANLAKKESLTDDYNQHAKQARMIGKSLK